MATRIYTVSDGNNERLVRATSRAQAIGHIARTTYKARVSTQGDLELHLTTGAKVEDATKADDDQEEQA